MPFQSAIGLQQGFGVPGELHNDSPLRAQPAVLNSTDPLLNVFGSAFTWLAGATGTPIAATPSTDPKPLTARAGAASATTSRFAGLLANPKEHALLGTTAGGTLAASLVLPNGVVASLVTEGDLIVSLPAAASPGDLVWFLIADGTLVTAAPNAAQPANTFAHPIGTVERYVSTGANLAVVHVEPITTLAA